MSKNNKVNRDHYVQRGRLTPDEAAREVVKQRGAASPTRTEGKSQAFQSRKPRLTREDPPSRRESPAATADKQHQETRPPKQSD
jgi:hypothetical protein